MVSVEHTCSLLLVAFVGERKGRGLSDWWSSCVNATVNGHCQVAANGFQIEFDLLHARSLACPSRFDE